MKKNQLIQLLSLLILVIAISCNDTNDDNAPRAPFSGNWKVVAIQLPEEQTPFNAPANESIIISFISSDRFSGETEKNQFQGRYEFNDSIFTMLDFSTTEFDDMSFAVAFYDAITLAQIPDQSFVEFTYSFNGPVLILRFADSGQMTLEKQ